MKQMYPPKITYSTPYVSIEVALPCNMSRDGKILHHPLPQETEIRDKIISFANDISEIYDEDSNYEQR